MVAMSSRSKYYTPNEVALHNTPSDLWVSFLGKVYDLTELILQNKGNELIAPIMAVAGQDISHWFDSRTGDVKTHVDAEKVSKSNTVM
jgi:cytochrome b involved in lipid metabolism